MYPEIAPNGTISVLPMTDAKQGGDLEAGRYTWIRCAGCGNGLWRQYPDRAEMPITVRGHQKRVVVITPEAMPWVTVRCEKCGSTWGDR